jgi:hypothetical protein
MKIPSIRTTARSNKRRHEQNGELTEDGDDDDDDDRDGAEEGEEEASESSPMKKQRRQREDEQQQQRQQQQEQQQEEEEEEEEERRVLPHPVVETIYNSVKELATGFDESTQNVIDKLEIIKKGLIENNRIAKEALLYAFEERIEAICEIARNNALVDKKIKGIKDTVANLRGEIGA